MIELFLEYWLVILGISAAILLGSKLARRRP